MLSIEEQRKSIKRQLELVKENQELTKELEFRDYRMKKLEKELEDLKSRFIQMSENKLKATYERIKIYG